MLKKILAALALILPISLAAQDLPSGGKDIFPKPVLDMLETGDLGNGTGTSEKVPVEGQTFKEALKLTTLKPTAQKWNIGVDANLPVETKAGDVILAQFWIRAVQGHGESGEAKSEFVFERVGDPWTKAIEHSLSVGPQWKKFSLPFTCVEDLPAGKSHITFRMGYGPQCYELADLKLVTYGDKVKISDLPQTKETYEGMEPDAPWRKAAQDRIEQIRKGALTVTVKDKDGNPVTGASVSIQMKRHAFGFGTCVVASRLVATDNDDVRYQKEIERLFNKVVFENDLKWPFWEEGASNSGTWNRQNVWAAVKWLSDRHIDIRGHNLVWGKWDNLPPSLESLKDDKKALEKAIEAHILDEGGAMKGHLVEWDVVNEPFVEHTLTDILGPEAPVSWYQKAREADPHALLFVNDYPNPDSAGHLDGDEAFIKNLLANKAPLGGFGLQGHVGESPWSIPALLKVIDRFGAYGIPVEITEFDTQIRDEEMEGQFFKDFLTAVFSDPSTNGFLMWGFWDGAQYNHKAPMFNQDWTEKPAGKAFEQLVFHDWWTNAAGSTDEKGSYQARGFLGDYEITVKSGSKTATVPAKLTKDALTLSVVLK